MENDIKESRERIFELDVLRGLAALSVLLFHYTRKYADIYGHANDPLFLWSHGHYGVHFFFLISGFVIFMTLTRTKRPMDFVISRFSRLYPAYWAAAAITFTVVLIFGLPKREAPWVDALVNLSMLQEAFGYKHIEGAYWSLQAEVFFYGWMFLLYLTRTLRFIVPIFLVWVLASVQLEPLLRATGVMDHNFPELVKKILLFEWVHLFALGILFYRLKQAGRWNLLELALLCACFYKQYGIRNPWSIFLIQGFAVVFYLLVTGQLRFLGIRPLLFLGTISYPLYLIHQNIGYIVIRNMEARGVEATASVFLALGVSIGLASALTFAVEKPALRWIRRKWKHHKETRSSLLDRAKEAASST